MKATEGQRQAIQNNLNSIVAGARRIAASDEGDSAELLRILRDMDSAVWMGVPDTSEIPKGDRVLVHTNGFDPDHSADGQRS